MLLHPTTIETSRLTWDASSRLFASDDSDLPRPSQVYDDACDVGYTLRSHLTGQEIVFVQSNVVRDREGDIMFWVYTPAPEDRVARRVGFTATSLVLHIFND